MIKAKVVRMIKNHWITSPRNSYRINCGYLPPLDPDWLESSVLEWVKEFSITLNTKYMASLHHLNS